MLYAEAAMAAVALVVFLALSSALPKRAMAVKVEVESAPA
jgi:hypothetical protein